MTRRSPITNPCSWMGRGGSRERCSAAPIPPERAIAREARARARGSAIALSPTRLRARTRAAGTRRRCPLAHCLRETASVVPVLAVDIRPARSYDRPLPYDCGFGRGVRSVTALLYLDDSYLRTFDATVTAVVGETGVVLDRTAFYPGGGGQPHDLGTLTDGTHSWQVVRIAREDGQIVHVLEGGAPPPPGTALRGEIDWDRR